MNQQTQNTIDPYIRFIVGTDNHLGANESLNIKSERGQDSYDSFEEILQIAQTEKADFVILGGDLFHEKRPSEHCLLKCVDILQKHVFGSNFGGISVEANSLNFKPNFHNSNFNIQMPIFIINGNHDNFITEQEEHVSILDILHESKYLNYFGKITNQSQINVKPIVIVKSNIKIALYGIGYMKDYQLSKLLAAGKVILEDLNESNFNILVIHQNRYKGTHFADEKDFLDPMQFRRFKINLLIWGHEHEAQLLISISKYVLEQVEQFHVFQCGSSVATSLIEAEGLVKQCGFFTLASDGMEFQSIKLHKSHRPIILKNVELAELVKSKAQQQQTQQEMAEKMLFDLVDAELRKYYAQNPYREKKPLLRFKVEYSGFELMKIRYLETKFADKVANPEKIFQFWEKRQNIQKQQEQREQSIQVMNKNFLQILNTKNYQVENEQMVFDCTQVIKSKLLKMHCNLVNPIDVIAFLDVRKTEKNNVFEQLQNQIMQKHKNIVMPPFEKEIEEIIHTQREYENEQAYQFKNKIAHDFKGQPKEIVEYNSNYQLLLNKHYDNLITQLKSTTQICIKEEQGQISQECIQEKQEQNVLKDQVVNNLQKIDDDEDIMFFDLMDQKSQQYQQQQQQQQSLEYQNIKEESSPIIILPKQSKRQGKKKQASKVQIKQEYNKKKKSNSFF